MANTLVAQKAIGPLPKQKMEPYPPKKPLRLWIIFFGLVMLPLQLTRLVPNCLKACFGKQQKPFEELLLSQEAVRKIAEEIFHEGYASIPWSEATERLFKDYKTPDIKKNLHIIPGPSYTTSYHLSSLTLKSGNQYNHEGKAMPSRNKCLGEKTVNSFVKSLAVELYKMTTGDNPITWTIENQEKFKSYLNEVDNNLTPEDMEIRECFMPVSDQLHQDKLPKIITMIATIQGELTEYIPPELLREIENGKQVEHSLKQQLPTSELPDNHIHIFLGKHFLRTLEELRKQFPETTFNEPPILVHKAPGTPDRVIFLARFKVPNIIEIIKNLKAQQASN